MDYRHEWKHEITAADQAEIRQRLRAVARPDPHAHGGVYRVRSLYFDTPTDRALREKLSGVSRREKFRIRCYDSDPDALQLEKKSKLGGLGSKLSASLTRQEVRRLLRGDLDWMADSGRPLVQELYHKMRTQGLAPRTIVDYLREPYVFTAGNVRVTLDSDIRTGLRSVDLLDLHCPLVPVPGAPIILEVKWDAFLPDVIRDAVQLTGRRVCAFSKYAACRVYD